MNFDNKKIKKKDIDDLTNESDIACKKSIEINLFSFNL